MYYCLTDRHANRLEQLEQFLNLNRTGMVTVDQREDLPFKRLELIYFLQTHLNSLIVSSLSFGGGADDSADMEVEKRKTEEHFELSSSLRSREMKERIWKFFCYNKITEEQRTVAR